MQLLDDEGQPLHWGTDGNFWDIMKTTNNKGPAGSWIGVDMMRKNGGDSWCTDLWSTTRLIEKVGCENVRVRCDATDVGWVAEDNTWEKYYRDVNLPPAKECLKRKCVISESESDTPTMTLESSIQNKDGMGAIHFTGIAAAVCAVSAVLATALRRRTPRMTAQPLLG